MSPRDRRPRGPSGEARSGVPASIDERRRRAHARRRGHRRLAVLCAAVVVAVVGALAALGVDEGDDARRPAEGAAPARPVRQPVDGLSTSEQVGQLLVISFKGASAPAYVREALAAGRAGGVVLFRPNAVSAPQTRALTRQLQAAAGGRALVSADQEGGGGRILPWAPPAQSQPYQDGRAGAAAAARAAARGLRRSGVNVTLAPVLDVATTPSSVMRGRAFSGDAAAVASRARAALGAYERGRVAATVKHFPGIGAAARNTDDAPVTLTASRGEVAGRDLVPFREAVSARVPLVMASHALYPAYDRRRIASQSRVLLTDLLRERLGFRGAVVTDSLEATAVQARSSVDTAALRSLAAGADLLLMTGPGSFPRVRRALLAEARRSPAVRRRIRQAAATVLALKRGMGLPSPRS